MAGKLLGQPLTCAGLSTGIFRVAWQSVEEVVGELEGGQLWHLEEAAGDVGYLVVGGIEVCQAVRGRGIRYLMALVNVT